MRSVTILSVALVFGMGLAGCLSGGGSTAKDQLSKALSLGEDWSPDAVFEGVFTLEVRDAVNASKELERDRANATAGGDAEENGGEAALRRVLLRDDASVGDGKAPVWLYGFRNATSSLVLVLDSSGREVFRNETRNDATGAGDHAVLTETWKIDSDEASERAGAANATFGRLRGHADVANTILFQGPKDKHPYWVMFVNGELDDEPASVALGVDANNGTVTDFGRFFDFTFYGNYNIGFGQQEDGTVSGSLNIVQPDSSNQFSITNEEHQELTLAFIAENGVPINQVTAVVTAPDGTTTTMTATGGLPFTNSPEMATIENPQAGDYMVDFHLDQGAQQSYRLDWCTDGFGSNFNPFGAGNAAC